MLQRRNSSRRAEMDSSPVIAIEIKRTATMRGFFLAMVTMQI
jgi:hypothetical protein